MPRIPEVGDVGRLPPIAELVGLQEEEDSLAARLGFTKIANPWDERDAHLFKAPLSGLNANAYVDVDPLAKNEGAGRARRIESLKAWIRSQLALGETVDELEKHARQHDVETASLIREAAGSL